MTDWTAQNPDFAEMVRGVVLSMPAAKHLGFHFGRIEPGLAEVIQPYRTELTQHDGFFQGGVLGSLADFAGGSAAGTLLPPGWANMTVDYSIKIFAPARAGEIVAVGRVVNPGKMLSVAAAEVYSVEDDERKLCATGLVTLRNVRLPGA